MQKSPAMRISRPHTLTLMAKSACLALVGLGLIFASVPARAGAPEFRSPEVALKQGLGAYSGGYYEIAVPALEYAASKRSLIAKFYLAQIFSDNMNARTDHARAFQIYRGIVREYSGIDDHDPRAPLVGQAITAYAKYLKTGLPELNLSPSPERAHTYFNNASMTFNNEDAQFELAKMFLAGDGVKRNQRLARHWLSSLTRKGHPGAQAFLADLLWRGKHVKADPVRALALIAVAVKNAPPQERLWIEDIYQTIYCGAAEGVRTQATGIVANWGKRYDRKFRRRSIGRHPVFGDVSTIRTCKDGETVGSMWEEEASPTPARAGDGGDAGDRGDHLADDTQPLAARAPDAPTFSLGGAAPRRGDIRPSLGMRDVSTPAPRR